MRVFKGRVTPVVLGAAVIVGALNFAAYAANGHPLLLGGSNGESRTASVTNTGTGPALTLKTSPKAPPLTVTSSKLVKHLNADTVDGLSASSLGVTVMKFVLTNGDSGFVFNGVAAGAYLMTVDYATQTGSVGGSVEVDVNGARAGEFYGPTDGTAAVVSGSTVITVPAGGTVSLASNGAAYTNPAGFISTVTLTRVSKLTSGSVTGH